MATTYTCDMCKVTKNSSELVTLKLLDGEHPHNGSTMYEYVDFCLPCLQRVLEKSNKMPSLSIEVSDAKGMAKL